MTSISNKEHVPTKSKIIFGSSIGGMMRTIIGFPLEHPIDSIKTQWQANPKFKNEFHVSKAFSNNLPLYNLGQIIKQIYQDKGIFKGFYAGSIPNLTRCIVKNSYRYPLMVGLPTFYKEKVLPNASYGTLKLITALNIAFVEATLTCPIERLKVYFMTKQNNHEVPTYKQFFSKYKSNLGQELFRGYTPLFVRQAMAWGLFLETDYAVKQTVRSQLGIDKSEAIPTKYLLPCSLIVALVNSAIVIPFDCVKTQLEKVDPTKTYKHTVKIIYQNGGIRAFFTGIRLRFLLSFTNALFAVNFLEKLEFYMNKKQH